MSKQIKFRVHEIFFEFSSQENKLLSDFPFMNNQLVVILSKLSEINFRKACDQNCSVCLEIKIDLT
jgi:hypothetical protein